jgi:hypothetical protein
LTIHGSRLLDTPSRQIDGRGDGQPGGDYIAKMTKTGAVAIIAIDSSSPSGPAGRAMDDLFKTGYHLAE